MATMQVNPFYVSQTDDARPHSQLRTAVFCRNSFNALVPLLSADSEFEIFNWDKTLYFSSTMYLHRLHIVYIVES